MKPEAHLSAHGAGVRYEKTDVDTSAVTRVGILVAVVAAVASLAIIPFVWQLEAEFAESQPPPPPMALRGPDRQPPEPRLQERPFDDVEALRAEEQALLTSYGWADEERGLARIPIDEAMRLLVERGVPARDAAAPAIHGASR